MIFYGYVYKFMKFFAVAGVAALLASTVPEKDRPRIVNPASIKQVGAPYTPLLFPFLSFPFLFFDVPQFHAHLNS